MASDISFSSSGISNTRSGISIVFSDISITLSGISISASDIPILHLSLLLYTAELSCNQLAPATPAKRSSPF